MSNLPKRKESKKLSRVRFLWPLLSSQISNNLRKKILMLNWKPNSRESKLKLKKKRERELKKGRYLRSKQRKLESKKSRLWSKKLLRRRSSRKNKNKKQRKRSSLKMKLTKLRRLPRRLDTILLRLKRRRNLPRMNKKPERPRKQLKRLLRLLQMLKMLERRFKLPKNRLRRRFLLPKLSLKSKKRPKKLHNQESRPWKKERLSSRKSKMLPQKDSKKKNNFRRIELRLSKTNWPPKPRRMPSISLNSQRSKKTDRRVR